MATDFLDNIIAPVNTYEESDFLGQIAIINPPRTEANDFINVIRDIRGYAADLILAAQDPNCIYGELVIKYDDFISKYNEVIPAVQSILVFKEEVLTVASLETEILSLYADKDTIDRIFASIDNIDRVYTSIDSVDRLNTGATANNIDRIHTSIDNLDRVHTSIDNVDTVEASITNVDTAATNIASINTVANASNLADVIRVADDLNSLDLNAQSDVIIVATDLNLGAASNTIIVATDIDNVNLTGTNIVDVNTTADSIGSVNTVALNIDDVNTTAGIDTEIVIVAGINEAVTRLDTGNTANNIDRLNTGVTADSIDRLNTGATANAIDTLGDTETSTAIDRLNTGTTADAIDILGDTETSNALDRLNTGSTANSIDRLNTGTTADSIDVLGGATTSAALDRLNTGATASNIDRLETSADNIDRVFTSIDNLDTVEASIGNVDTTATNIADVNTIADNITDVTYFADRYQGDKAVAPTLRNDGSALAPGDLYFDISDAEEENHAMKIHNGTTWTNGYSNSYTIPEANVLLFLKSDKSNVLELDNIEEYTPGADYHPATKAYADAVALTGDGNVAITTIQRFIAQTGNDGITFPISGGYTTGSVTVTYMGTELDAADYNDSDGLNIVLTEIADAGVFISVTIYGGADVYNKTQIGAFLASKASVGDNNTFTAAQRGQISTLGFSSKISPGFNVSNRYKVILTDITVIENPTNLTEGQGGIIYIEQDGTGGHTVTWGTNWNFMVAPVEDTNASKVNIYAYEVYSSTQIVASYLGSM